MREAVAFNSATPPEVLIELAGSRMDPALIVALNPDVPIGILGALVGDPDPLVNFVASGVRGERERLLEHPHPPRRIAGRAARPGRRGGRRYATR